MENGKTMMQTALEEGMRLALLEAETAAGEGEVPIGAVVMCGGVVIAREHNRSVQRQDMTAHAELLVMQTAAKLRGASFRLYAVRDARTLRHVCGGGGKSSAFHARLRRI